MLQEIDSAPLPLIPPQFGKPGPYRPRMRVPITLPVTNLRDEQERDLLVTFHARGATVTPATCKIDCLEARDVRSVRAEATIDDLSDGEEISVWAQIDVPGRSEPFLTARANARVTAHARLSLHATTDGRTTEIEARNDGYTTATFRLCLSHATGAAPDWDAGEDGTLTSPSYRLAPGAHQRISVPASGATVRAATDDGERSFARVVRRSDIVPSLDAPTFLVSAPSDGVRAGDIVYLQLPISAPGAAIEGITATIEVPGGLALVEGSLAIDDVGVVPDDIVADARLIIVKIGRIEGSATLRCALLASVSRRDDRETLEISATIAAPTIAPRSVSTTIPIDRRAAFASTHTYIGDLRDDDDGYSVDVTITNPDALPMERVRIRWSIGGVVPLAVQDNLGRDLILQPGTFAGNPCLITDLGALGSHERRTLTLRLEPLYALEAERHIAVSAMLLVDTTAIDLGTAHRDIAAEPNLIHSALTCNHTTLRIGIPRRIELQVTNTGASLAKDVRLALDLPDYLHVHGLRPREGDARWYSLYDALPPGASVRTSLLLALVATPHADQIVIEPIIDADNHAQIALAPLALATPTAPLLQSPEIFLESDTAGVLIARARISNIGDGVAHNVIVRAPERHDVDIVPGSITVDGVPQPSLVGARSAIVSGLRLGSLPPDTYRTIQWLLAPHTSAAYTAELQLDALDAERRPLPTLLGYSAPRSVAPPTQLETALPQARQLSEDVAERAPSRARIMHVVVDHPAPEALTDSAAPLNAPELPEDAAGAPTDQPVDRRERVEEPSLQTDDPEAPGLEQPLDALIHDGSAPAEAIAHPDPSAAALEEEEEDEAGVPELAGTADADDMLQAQDVPENKAYLDVEAETHQRAFQVLNDLHRRGDGGLLPHVLASRLLVADYIPDLDADQNRELTKIHQATDALAMMWRKNRYIGPPAEKWLRHLSAYDEQILPVAVALIEAMYGSEADPVTPETLTRSLMLLHADVVVRRGSRTHDRLQDYSSAIASYFDPEHEPDLIAIADDGLDRALGDFLDAAGVTS